MKRRVLGVIATLVIGSTCLSATASADGSTPSKDAEKAGSVRIFGPSRLVVNQAYENLRWRMTGVEYSDDFFEWCTVELENRATRRTAGDDWPDEYEYSGVMRVYDYAVDYAKPGRYDLQAECYWAGTDSKPLVVKFGSRTAITRFERSGRTVTVIGKVKQYTGTGDWKGWKGTRVTLQKKVGKRWKPVDSTRSKARGVMGIQARVPQGTQVRLAAGSSKTTFGSFSKPKK